MQVAQKGKNGHKQLETAKNLDDKIVVLKTEILSLSTLSDLMPVSNQGRFMEIKADIKRRITTVGPNEYIFLPATRKMKKNKKERQSVMNAVMNMFTLAKLDWLIRWTDVRHGFLVVRCADWEKIKKGGAKNG
jgi:hypothetical protein